MISDDEEDADLIAVLFANRLNWDGLLEYAEMRVVNSHADSWVGDHWIEKAMRHASKAAVRRWTDLMANPDTPTPEGE